VRVASIVVAVVAVGGSCRAAVAAPCVGTDACLQVIEASQRTTRALSARFEQVKHLSLLNEPLVTRGQFAFHEPDQVLWQVDDPPIMVRIDHDGVHLPDLPGAKDEVAALAPFSAMMRQLSGLFTGALSTVRNSFEVSAAPAGDAIRIHLVPREAQWQRMFRAIDVSFAAPDWVVATIHIEEALGDSLDITFSDVHRNDDVANAALGAVPARHE
jgi:outer membrane lipoprotein-sorting protein